MNDFLRKILGLESPAIPLLVIVFTVSLIVSVPYKIIGLGYVPQDDATRHSAIAVAGKSWNDVLVLREPLKMDTHPGWHFLLGVVHKASNWLPLGLATFSVASLFILTALTPAFLLRRPEAWLLTLLFFFVAENGALSRLLIGRPLLITTAYMLVFGLSWEKLGKTPFNYRFFFAMAMAAAFSAWMHCAWYLLFLPCAALFLAREWRAGTALSASVVAGIAAGALFTGRPFLFLTQTVRHFFLSLYGATPESLLVAEFQPGSGDYPFILIFALLMILRFLRGGWSAKTVDNPVFILTGLCWALSFMVGRIWTDIGLAAGMAWIAREVDGMLEGFPGFYSLKRLLFSLAVMSVMFRAATNDANGRWSSNRPLLHMTPASVEDVSWLPGKWGIVYSNDMRVFYSMFFRNPGADWKYMVGFDPALMPEEDLKVFINIQNDARNAYDPWVAKMRPEDRMVLLLPGGILPLVSGLEWKYIENTAWCGRLPAKRGAGNFH